jgi:hypothetical protein
MLFTAYYIQSDNFINITLLPCSTVAICEFKKGMLLNDDSKLSVVIRNRFSLEKFYFFRLTLTPFLFILDDYAVWLKRLNHIHAILGI